MAERSSGRTRPSRDRRRSGRTLREPGRRGRRRRPARPRRPSPSGPGRRAVEPRRAAELGHADHQRLVEQPPPVQVFDERREGPIRRRDENVLEPGRFLDVAVPAGVVGGSSGPRYQLTCTSRTPASTSRRASSTLWPNGRCAVAVAVRLRLVLEAERLPRLGGAEQVERLAVVLVDNVAAGEPRPGRRARAWSRSRRSMRRPRRPGSMSAGRSISWSGTLGREPGVEQPGVGDPAQEAGVLARPDAAVGVEDPVRQRDRRRQARRGLVPTVRARPPGSGSRWADPGWRSRSSSAGAAGR